MAKEKNTPVQDYFDANKGIKVVYGTSDGQLFEAKQYAQGHANTLEKDKGKVDTLKNPLFIEVELETENEQE